MAATESFCRFEAADDTVTVTLLPAINEAPWSEIEQAGGELLDKVRSSAAPLVLVDLTPLSHMGSALVALLVRVWKVVKEREGRLIVVNSDPMVFEVLKIAGLDNLWTIVGSREEAFDAGGVSPQAVTRRRETRVLTLVGPLAVVAAGIGLALLIFKAAFVPSGVALGLALGWAALGLLAGAVTFARSSGGGRALAGLVVAGCLGVAITTVFFWPADLTARAAGDEQPAAPAAGASAAGAGETPPDAAGTDAAMPSPPRSQDVPHE